MTVTQGVIDINISQEVPVHRTHQDLKSIKPAPGPDTSLSTSISTAMNSSEVSSSPSSLTVSTNTESHDEGSPRHDNAKSQTSQIQREAQPRQHQESTQVTEIENNESINSSQPHFYPSFTSSAEYDYGGNEDYFYAAADPILSQEQASILLNPSSYNFSGLQVGYTNIWFNMVCGVFTISMLFIMHWSHHILSQNSTKNNSTFAR